jgi:hypothetical protein
MKRFFIATIGMLMVFVVRAQDVSTAGLHQPVNVNDAVVTGGVLRTQVLHDSLMMNTATGRMEKTPVVVDYLDVPVDKLGGKPEEAIEAAKVASRAAMSRASASGSLDFSDYYSGVAYYLYTFNYPSIDKHGNRIILSSLMAFPYFTESNWNDGYRFNNIVIGCHCTITSNKECPSLYPSGGFFQSDVNMMQYYASWGKGVRKAKDDPAYYNVLIMPDYEGYGVSKDRPHPYLYQELTARQVIDGVRYGLALFKNGMFTGKKESVSPQWAQSSDAFRYGKFFSIGVSQGGSVAMAVQRFIEQNNLTEEFPFKGSICADGPYDPVATLKYYMKEDTGSGHKAGELTMPVAIALIIKGMLDTNPLMMKYKPTDFFSQLFLDTGILTIIADKQYPSLEMTTDDVKDHLENLAKYDKYKNLLTSDGRANLEYVLTPRGWDYMTKLANGEELPDYEEMNDLISALESNNLTKGWIPQNPVCLFHSLHDTVVPYDNCVSARDAFNNKVTFYLDDRSTNSDHIDACTDFMFSAVRTSPDIKFIRTLFNYGNNQYSPYNN